MERREPLLSFVKKELSLDASGHDVEHALRVEANARRIQATEGGNLEIIVASALLHDVIDEKLFDDTEAQKEKVRSLLVGLDYPEEEILAILDIISTMSWHKREDLASLPCLEQQIVTDADRLDAMGAIGVARTFAYGGAHGRPLSGGIKHFHDKLLHLHKYLYTKTAKRLAKKRAAFLYLYLDAWHDETGSID